eukprot:TRINITY_DN19121_c0_g1_i1.p1 TRINITY_DN19121_c0_g1~~TRINITY_DN19121_c0_g1_i1.p1  ORF type:complete len:1059 (+),score=215.02 TRINITY_DN19121_c0_g1_i1:300-3179(+)
MLLQSLLMVEKAKVKKLELKISSMRSQRDILDGASSAASKAVQELNAAVRRVAVLVQLPADRRHRLPIGGELSSYPRNVDLQDAIADAVTSIDVVSAWLSEIGIPTLSLQGKQPGSAVEYSRALKCTQTQPVFIIDQGRMAKVQAKLKVTKSAFKRLKERIRKDLTEARAANSAQMQDMLDAVASFGTSSPQQSPSTEVSLSEMKPVPGRGAARLRLAASTALGRAREGSAYIEEGFSVRPRGVDEEIAARVRVEDRLGDEIRARECLEAKLLEQTQLCQKAQADAAARRGELFAIRAHMLRLRSQAEQFKTWQADTESRTADAAQLLIAGVAEMDRHLGYSDVETVPEAVKTAFATARRDIIELTTPPAPLGLDHMVVVLHKVRHAFTAGLRLLQSALRSFRPSFGRIGSFADVDDEDDVFAANAQYVIDGEEELRGYLERCEAALSPLPHFRAAREAAGTFAEKVMLMSAAAEAAEKTEMPAPPVPLPPPPKMSLRPTLHSRFRSGRRARSGYDPDDFSYMQGIGTRSETLIVEQRGSRALSGGRAGVFYAESEVSTPKHSMHAGNLHLRGRSFRSGRGSRAGDSPLPAADAVVRTLSVSGLRSPSTGTLVHPRTSLQESTRVLWERQPLSPTPLPAREPEDQKEPSNCESQHSEKPVSVVFDHIRMPSPRKKRGRVSTYIASGWREQDEPLAQSRAEKLPTSGWLAGANNFQGQDPDDPSMPSFYELYSQGPYSVTMLDAKDPALLAGEHQLERALLERVCFCHRCGAGPQAPERAQSNSAQRCAAGCGTLLYFGPRVGSALGRYETDLWLHAVAPQVLHARQLMSRGGQQRDGTASPGRQSPARRGVVGLRPRPPSPRRRFSGGVPCPPAVLQRTPGQAGDGRQRGKQLRPVRQRSVNIPGVMVGDGSKRKATRAKHADARTRQPRQAPAEQSPAAPGGDSFLPPVGSGAPSARQ